MVIGPQSRLVSLDWRGERLLIRSYLLVDEDPRWIHVVGLALVIGALASFGQPSGS